MNRMLVVFLAAWAASTVVAQDAATPPTEVTAPALTEAEVEARRSEIEDDPALEENLKKSLLAPYDEALVLLGQAQSDRSKEADFRETRQSAPVQLEELGGEIERWKTRGDSEPTFADLGLPEEASAQQIEDALEKERIQLNELKVELEAIEEDLSESRTRPEQIRARLISGRQEIDGVEESIADAKAKLEQDPENRTQSGILTREEAKREALLAELAMLDEENLSAPIRRSLAEEMQKLSVLQISQAESRVSALQVAADSLLSRQLREVARLLRQVAELPDAERSEPLKEAQADLESLVEEVRKVSELIKQAEEEEKQRSLRRQQILDQFSSLSRQIEIGGVDGAFGAVLLEARQSLPSNRSLRERMRTLKRRIQEARSGLFVVEQAILSEGSEGGASSDEVVSSLEAASDGLREDLRSGYRRLIRDLGDLDLIERQIREESRKLGDYLGEQLFWVRSSSAVSAMSLRELPKGLSWAYGAHRLKDLGQAIRGWTTWVYFLLIAGVVGLVLPRRRARAKLKEVGLKTRKISTDRYRHTVIALFLTAFLAAAGPFLALTVGLGLAIQDGATDWSYNIGMGLVLFGWFFFKANFVIELCQPGELGEHHFRWKRGPLSLVASCARISIPIYAFFVITLRLVLGEEAGSYVDGLGRFASLVGIVGFGCLLTFLLHPVKGVAAAIREQNPESLIGRLRKLWFVIAILWFVGLSVLLLIGFVIPVQLLLWQIEASLTAIGIAFLAYGLIIRWFDLKQRRLALEEAIKERRRRNEAAHQGEKEGVEDPQGGAASTKLVSHPEAVGDESGALSVEVNLEEEMDLQDVEDQTRRLVGFLVGVGLLVNLGYLWANFGPVFRMLDNVESVGGLSLADLGILVLVVAVTSSAVRNLPGLLELAVLRRLNLDAGTKTAVTTLARYGVVAIGSAVLFQQLGVDWSKFGWIAAALSVGLGFGLQEVVANFISGLIILFERPIRVGDIVTVDGIDGVVSRIQIRATTITNWDRKEFVVPNKNFVTGTVLNWTLSSSVNRIVVVVGVAYGSDTEKARQLLIDAAHEHPRVLDDPAPFSTFEEFQDSALKLILRCFIPDMDGRVGIISDLHTAIDKKFAAAGIEIAFPQQDLHLRSVDATAVSSLVPRKEDGEKT